MFHHPEYLLRRKVFKLLGGAFHIYDASGGLAFYSRQKAFKLKEDIRVFTDESMQSEVLLIKARNIIDFAATYDVFDSRSGSLVGSLRRKGIKSIVVDEWHFLDTAGQQIGVLREDSVGLALLRRLVVGALLPQEYRGEVNGRQVCVFRRNFNPFVSKVRLNYAMDTDGMLDRRLGIAAAVLLLAIEGKQR